MPNTPESKVAVSERAGFIDAPETNAKRNVLESKEAAKKVEGRIQRG
jgi:hypothetical protein